MALTGPARTPGTSVADHGTVVREALERYAPRGFRDEDGVWHEGPLRRDALAALDAILAHVTQLEEALEALLEVAERTRGGGGVSPEWWYAVRDCARAALARDGRADQPEDGA